MTPREAALAGEAAGLSIVPPREDGSKAPLGEWKTYQTTRPSPQQIETWYRQDRHGIGLVCGAVSGNLELLEFETEAVSIAYLEAAHEAGLGPLVDRIEAGYLEASPAGGTHWLYHCDQIAGNTKLASEPGPQPGTVKTLIETRGEGGYVIVSPSGGQVHPSGRPYRLLQGGFASIATIAPAERAELHRLARTLDRMPQPAPASAPAPSEPARHGQAAGAEGLRPGDDYNQRTTWPDLLTPAGWTLVYQRGGTGHWRRPGKPLGISATTNHQGSGLLYVFSTKTVLEAERSYDPFGAYAGLHHGGDLEAAAKALYALGYGDHPDHPGKPCRTGCPNVRCAECGAWTATLADHQRRHQPPDDGWEPPAAEHARRQPAGDLFRLWSPAELLAQDRTFTWSVRGMLAARTYGPIGGERKSLKTYVATFIAIGAAAGKPIFDHFQVEQATPVVIYCGEGGRIPYTRRLERVAAAMGTSLTDLELFTSFDVAPIGSLRFTESLHRDLQRKPGLVIVDPLYAYHPATTKASDLYQRGAMLTSISTPCVDAGACLLLPDHWNKGGTGRGLDRISQVGVQEWADTWLLLSHREPPEVEAGRFRLLLEIGSRQWGGSSWSLDLDIGRFDPDLGSHDGTIAWDLRRTASGPGPDASTEDAILALLNDEPFKHTETAVVREIGGGRDRTRAALKRLFEQHRIITITVPRREGNRVVRRDLVGIAGATSPPNSGAVGIVASQEEHSSRSQAQSNHAGRTARLGGEASGEQPREPSPSHRDGSVARLPDPSSVPDGSGRVWQGTAAWNADDSPGGPMRSWDCDRCGFATTDPRVARYSHSGCGGDFQPAEAAP